MASDAQSARRAPIGRISSPFQILLRNAPPFVEGQPLPAGGTPPDYELGWKDTVIVCHLLEHEDHGMMGQYVVGEPAYLPLLKR